MLKLSSIYFLFYFSLGSSLLYFSTFFDSLGVSGKVTGLIFSLGSLLAMFWQPFVGFISDKTKKDKEILISLMLIMLAVSLLFNFMGNSLLLGICYILYSMSIWGFMPLIDSVAVNTEHSFGKIRLWGSVGFAAGSFVSGKVISTWGIKNFLYVTAMVALLTIISISTLQVTHSKDHEKADFSDISNLLKNREYISFIIFTILILGGLNSHNTFFSLYFERIGGSAVLFGSIVFLITLSEVPFMGITGKLSKKLGTRKILIFSGAIHSLRWILYYLFPSPFLVAATFFLQGASTGIYFATAADHIKNCVSKKTLSTAMTTFMAAGTLGGTLIQLVSGYSIDSFGIKSIYLIFMILAIVGTGVFAIEKK